MLFDRTALNKKDAIENEGIERIYNAVVASGGTMRAALRQRETVKYIITLKCGKMIDIGPYTAAMNHKCTWQRRIGLDGKHLNDHFCDNVMSPYSGEYSILIWLRFGGMRNS